jgi:hypothetical protein
MPPLRDSREENFCREYAKHGHGQRAVVAAGYQVKTWLEHGSTSASVVANRLLKDIKVLGRIQELQEQRARRADVSVEYVLTKLKTVVQRGLQEVRPIFSNDGTPTGEFEYDSHGVTQALKQIGTYLGMYDSKVAVPAGDTYNTQINFYVPENRRLREANGRHSGNGSAGAGSEAGAVSGTTSLVTLPSNGHGTH